MNAMDRTLRISLVVPTYNRARQLADALPTFLKQSLASDKYEVLLVDNNSTDDTRTIIERIFRNYPVAWRYVHESKQGLHHARNRGIREARGDIIVFGDDDIIADRGWLEHLLHEFEIDPQVGIVGGCVLPIWSELPPSWVFDYGTEKIHAVFAYLDHGEARLELDRSYVIGCNFAVRRTVAQLVGGSPPDTFPANLRRLSGSGESGMVDRARSLGFKVVYTPGAIVKHHVDASRMTLSYFVDRHRRWAIENAFSTFRQSGKWGASKTLVRGALSRIAHLAKTSRTVRRRDFYVAVQLAYAFETIVHVGRIAWDRGLYEHTLRDTYL